MLAVVVVVAVAPSQFSRGRRTPRSTHRPRSDKKRSLPRSPRSSLRSARGPWSQIIGINDATEVNDYVMPTGILRRADVADVLMVATGPGPVKLYPALTVEPDMTVAEFDARHPDGADYVIVPQMSRADDPAALQWIKAQSAKGATVIGVCAGARIVAEAGLLDNKRGTTHWFYLKKLREKHPSMQYVPNRRFVADQGVVTTTGITAAMPMSLTLIEAIAGREKAEAVARDLGLDHWDARHASDQFKFTLPFALTVMGKRSPSGIARNSASSSHRAWTRCRWPGRRTRGPEPIARAPSRSRDRPRRNRDTQRDSHRSGQSRRRSVEGRCRRSIREPSRRQRPWTRRCPTSSPATARAHATSSPCSWSIHG